MALKKDTIQSPQNALAKAKKDALRLVAFRARSTEELRSRLARKKHEPAVIGQVIESFVKQGLLDDRKFARLYAMSRAQSRPAGKHRIRRELEQKGLSSRLVEDAIGSIEDFDEKQVALDIALERHRRMSRLPENVSKVRLYGFLKRRGFTGEAVFYALSRLYRQTESFE